MFYYIKKNWLGSIGVCFLQISSWGMQTAVQLTLMWVFEAALQLDFKAFLFRTVIDLLLWGIYNLLCFLESYFRARLVRTLNNQVRHDLYLSLLQKDHKSYHEQDTGEYVSRFTNDVKQIEKLAWEPFFNLVGRAAQVIWSIVALAMLHWSMLIASLIITAIMWGAPRLFAKKLEKLSNNNAEAYAVGTSKIKDLLSGFDLLTSFGMNDRFLKSGDQVSDNMETANFRMNYTQDAVDCGIGFLSVVTQAVIDVLIVLLVLKNQLSIAVLSGGSNLSAGVSNGLMNFASLRLSLIAGKPYFSHINHHSDGYNQQGSSCASPIQHRIVAENLSFSYNEKEVLRNVSFCFEKGGKYALTGPSGCGKSTILKLLLGWLPDYTGNIYFDDKNAKAFPQEQLQSQMSYIEQDVFLFNTTIRDNITLGTDFSQDKLEDAIKRSALDSDLSNMPLGLDTPVGENGSNLSGGQKQRVAIARALIHNRSILLVDEGTSALDQKNADIVEQNLLSNPDLTLILVSHHLTEERKSQFTKVYELEPVVPILRDTNKLEVVETI